MKAEPPRQVFPSLLYRTVLDQLSEIRQACKNPV